MAWEYLPRIYFAIFIFLVRNIICSGNEILSWIFFQNHVISSTTKKTKVWITFGIKKVWFIHLPLLPANNAPARKIRKVLDLRHLPSPPAASLSFPAPPIMVSSSCALWRDILHFLSLARQIGGGCQIRWWFGWRAGARRQEAGAWVLALASMGLLVAVCAARPLRLQPTTSPGHSRSRASPTKIHIWEAKASAARWAPAIGGSAAWATTACITVVAVSAFPWWQLYRGWGLCVCLWCGWCWGSDDVLHLVLEREEAEYMTLPRSRKVIF